MLEHLRAVQPVLDVVALDEHAAGVEARCRARLAPARRARRRKRPSAAVPRAAPHRHARRRSPGTRDRWLRRASRSRTYFTPLLPPFAMRQSQDSSKSSNCCFVMMSRCPRVSAPSPAGSAGSPPRPSIAARTCRPSCSRARRRWRCRRTGGPIRCSSRPTSACRVLPASARGRGQRKRRGWRARGRRLEWRVCHPCEARYHVARHPSPAVGRLQCATVVGEI